LSPAAALSRIVIFSLSLIGSYTEEACSLAGPALNSPRDGGLRGNDADSVLVLGFCQK